MPTELTWPEVAARLAPARSYWLGTVSAVGAPHAAPVWGVVVDDDLYLYSERSTVKARNLVADPRVVVHLESAEDVVIVHGRLDDLGAPGERGDVVAALAAKYPDPDDAQYLPSQDPDFDVLYVLRPERAMAWRLDGYLTSQGRWRA
ncbi:MAG TPA: pyridoxamine 5'-phosphate oxidase family protein [Nocardioides sp.]|jgi:nitroimidazol reductase NimA-like FMN-containing flavoprotein (pyridoxamine 5'-phosphate oxidase superfamily)|nr:pyridoxamine 5'-phosphate oxidase family protein [Nocardioides sp.]